MSSFSLPLTTQYCIKLLLTLDSKNNPFQTSSLFGKNSINASGKIAMKLDNDDKIIGAAGMGGLFHVSSIQIDKNFRGKGIGRMLQGELIKEAGRRGFSFVTVFIEPQNEASVKLHSFFNYDTVFRIHYSNEKIIDVKIIILRSMGKIIKNFQKIRILYCTYCRNIIRQCNFFHNRFQ